MPQDAGPSDPLAKNAMQLDYDVYLRATSDAVLHLQLAPTLDTGGKGGPRLAVAIDDGAPQVLAMDLKPDTPAWNAAVSDNRVVLDLPIKQLKAGKHTIRFFRVDGNVVLERLLLQLYGVKPSYLWQPESGKVP